MKKRGYQFALTAKEFEIDVDPDGNEIKSFLAESPYILLGSTFDREVAQKSLDCFKSGLETFQAKKFIPVLQSELEREQAQKVDALLSMVEV